MRASERDSLLPVWEPESTSAAAVTEESTPMTILITVSASLESSLRAVVRDVDGVDSDLRKKISEHLSSPSKDQEQDASVVDSGDGAQGEEKRPSTVALPPALLARALPHVRRLMPCGEGEARVGALGLVRGGKLVFPESGGGARAAATKQGEDKREYEKRRNRLILLREQKEYARMTSNIQRAPRETVHDIQASFKFQAGMGANVVLAVVTTFIISYWASKFLVGHNTSHRMVIGLVGAVFMMLVELLVFVMRSLKADEVLEAARQDAEEKHTAVGVHRLAPRVEPKGGRGVLEENGANRGQYELVATTGGIDGGSDSNDGVSGAGIGTFAKR